VIIFIHLFSTISDAFFSSETKVPKSGLIIGLIICIDILLLIANYAIILRIIYGTWTLKIPKSIETQKKMTSHDLISNILDKKAIYYLLIWITSVIGIFIVTNIGLMVFFPYFILIDIIIGVIGFVAVMKFYSTVFRKQNK
jgi:hypothetical protein